MAETTLTVKQIMDLGLWEKVCDYKGWDYWIVNEGIIEEDEFVTFDSEFKHETKIKEDSFILKKEDRYLAFKVSDDNSEVYILLENWGEFNSITMDKNDIKVLIEYLNKTKDDLI